MNEKKISVKIGKLVKKYQEEADNCEKESKEYDLYIAFVNALKQAIRYG